MCDKQMNVDLLIYKVKSRLIINLRKRKFWSSSSSLPTFSNDSFKCYLIGGDKWCSCWTYSGRNTCGLRTLGSWMQGKRTCIQNWSQVLCFATDLLTIVVTAGSYVWSLTWFRLRPPHFPRLYLTARFLHLEDHQALFEWIKLVINCSFLGECT